MRLRAGVLLASSAGVGVFIREAIRVEHIRNAASIEGLLLMKIFIYMFNSNYQFIKQMPVV